MFNLFKQIAKFNPVVVSVKFDKKQSPVSVQSTPIFESKVSSNPNETYEMFQTLNNTETLGGKKRKPKRVQAKRKRTPRKKRASPVKK